MASLLHAQVPENVSVIPSSVQNNPTPDFVCGNFAGTFQLGQFIGQSNDISLDTLFFCFGDSIFIDHNGDFTLNGDPVPATQGGIGWAFYNCPPTISGDPLSTVITDCVVPGGPNGIWVYTGQQNGDAWFFNNGSLQNLFNSGQPVQIFFAPITLDILDTSVQPSVQGYESSQVGFPPGPCVNVNTNAAFSVVYLNAIQESGVSSNFGNDCLGKFRIQGGYPEFSTSSVFTIDISLAGNPNVKALIHTAKEQMFHGADIIFSVQQPGTYNVTVEDGKSCGHTFQIVMGVCDATDNVVLSFPEIIAPPGSTVCVPLTVQNYNSVSASFSITWDPTVLQYTGISNGDTSYVDPANFNTLQVSSGYLGAIVFNSDSLGAVISIPDGQAIFDICFTVIDSLGICSGLGITNTPSPVIIEGDMGQVLAVTVDTGFVCAGFLPLSMQVNLDTLCFGMATITVVPIGGTPPYEITINAVPPGVTYFTTLANYGDTYTTPQLMAGDYVITLIDQNGTALGDTIIQNITIAVESIGAALDLTQLPSCNGTKDGVVTATVFIGTTPVTNPESNFTFTWNVPNAPDTSILNSIGAGNIVVTVTDNSTGCQAFASGTLGQPAPLSDQASIITNATCTGVCDGGFFYSAEGGTTLPTGGYAFNWTYSPDDGATIFQDDVLQGNPIVLSNKCAGRYYVTITDANGCTFVDSLDVMAIRQIDINLASLSNANCKGSNDGAICIEVVETPPAPSPSYFFQWSPLGGTEIGTATTSCYSDLIAGTYQILAIDAVGCFAIDSFVVSEPATALNLDTLSLQNPGCGVFQSNGRIEVFATGGTGSPSTYTYAWDNGVTSPINQGLAAGTYCATVTDQNGCVDSLCIDLILPPPPAITLLDSVSVKCGDDGCLTLITNPPGANYNWTTLGGTPIPNSNSSTVCGLNGGSYAVTVTDATGCTLTDTLSLDTIVRLSLADTSFIEPSCFGIADGLISVGISGGTPVYTYMWTPNTTPPQNTPSIQGIASGFYTLKVTDAQGCIYSTELELKGPPEIVATFTGTPVSCFGVCDGTATPVVNYGTIPSTSGNFTFVWDNGNMDSIPTDLCSGWQQVLILDGNNCFIIDSVLIGSPEAVIAASVMADSVNCNGASDGSIFVTGGGGGGGPFTYLWSANANNATTSSVLGLPAGSYVVTITDADGCTGVSNIDIGEPDPIVLSDDAANTKDPDCFGSSDGVAAVIVMGGTGPFDYLWSNGTSQVGMKNPQDNLPAGIYTVTVTDANECTQTFEIFLNDPPPIQGFYDTLTPLICNGDETVLNIDTIFGGSGGPYQYSLDFGVTLDPGFPISIDGGEHYITYFDVRNCEHTDTIQVVEPAPIEVSFDPGDFPPTSVISINPLIVEIELGDSVLLTPIVSGAVVDSFIWAPSQYLTPGTFTPFAYTFESQVFTIIVFDANGCSGTGSITIEIDPNRNVFIPNIFKPGNTAGINDHFEPWIGRGVERVNYLRVYDRWGELMYSRDDYLPENQPASGWDGRYRGDWVLPGVYVYVVEVKFLDGRVLLYRGDVTVVR